MRTVGSLERFENEKKYNLILFLKDHLAHCMKMDWRTAGDKVPMFQIIVKSRQELMTQTRIVSGKLEGGK